MAIAGQMLGANLLSCEHFQPAEHSGGRLQRPQQPRDIPRGMEIAKKFGPAFLPHAE